MGSIRGYVFDEFGRPVENATVILPQIGYFELTHQNGSFYMTDVPNGNYTMHIVQRYYFPSVFKFEVYTDMIAKGIVLRTTSGSPNPEPYLGGAKEELSALEAKKGAEEALVKIPGVMGVGLDRSASQISVYTKDCTSKLISQIPKEIEGFPVNIICVGEIKPFVEIDKPQVQGSQPGSPPGSGGFPAIKEYRVKRYRPVVGGISAAHSSVGAGTLGAVVRRRGTGEKLLLSNNHVFANIDTTDQRRASEGDNIVQPGAWDAPRLLGMGITDNTIGRLSDWVQLDPTSPNLIDAAVAEPLVDDIAREYILANDSNELVRVMGTKAVTASMAVKAYCRTSEKITGKIIDWDATLKVTHNGREFTFKDQIVMEMDAGTHGDSGALILDSDNYAVGLLHSGAEIEGKMYIFACKINNVLSMLNAEFGKEPDEIPSWTTRVVLDPISLVGRGELFPLVAVAGLAAYALTDIARSPYPGKGAERRVRALKKRIYSSQHF